MRAAGFEVWQYALSACDLAPIGLGTNMPRYYLNCDMVTADDGWRLLRWCRAHGADEFTLDVVRECRGLPRPVAATREHELLLRPFFRGTALRECVRNGPTRQVDLFELSEASIDPLRTLLPFGLLSFWFHHIDSAPWVEDPAVYRGGELLLAVISHETFGEIRVSEEEKEELAGMGVLLQPGRGPIALSLDSH